MWKKEAGKKLINPFYNTLLETVTVPIRAALLPHAVCIHIGQNKQQESAKYK